MICGTFRFSGRNGPAACETNSRSGCLTAPLLNVSIGTKFDISQQYFSTSMPGSAGERGKTQNIAHNMHFEGVKGQLRMGIPKIHPIIYTSEAENGVQSSTQHYFSPALLNGSPAPAETG